jgi:hypothetical protein
MQIFFSKTNHELVLEAQEVPRDVQWTVDRFNRKFIAEPSELFAHRPILCKIKKSIEL